MDSSSSSSSSSSLEFGIKPKKKVLNSKEDFQQFHQNVKIKKKTELCNNFYFKGKCKFGENCSFAHGQVELKQKQHLNDNFKTKPCKNFFKEGYCSYGIRCQYIHSEIKNTVHWWGYLRKQYKKQKITYTFAWEKGEKGPKLIEDNRYDILRFYKLKEKYRDDFQADLVVLNREERNRLSIFIKLSQ